MCIRLNVALGPSTKHTPQWLRIFAVLLTPQGVTGSPLDVHAGRPKGNCNRKKEKILEGFSSPLLHEHRLLTSFLKWDIFSLLQWPCSLHFLSQYPLSICQWPQMLSVPPGILGNAISMGFHVWAPLSPLRWFASLKKLSANKEMNPAHSACAWCFPRKQGSALVPLVKYKARFQFFVDHQTFSFIHGFCRFHPSFESFRCTVF